MSENAKRHSALERAAQHATKQLAGLDEAFKLVERRRKEAAKTHRKASSKQ